MTDPSLRLGSVDLYLPDASDPDFWFCHDIASLLGHETNAQALAVLEKAIAEDDERPRGKLDIDHEADAVCVRTRRPELLIHTVRVLYRLAGLELDHDELASTLARARASKRPKPQPWKLGDLFSIPLNATTFAFGQVLGTHSTGPTLVLFEGRAPGLLRADEILELGFITILHTDGICLDSKEFAVLGHAEPAVDAASGPWGQGGTSTSDAVLKQFARVWYGLEPWNVLYREDYWDRLLFRGRPRPASALLLTPEQRAEYRRNHLGVEG